MILTKHRIIEEMVAHLPEPPPTREERQDEAAYLVDVAAYYDWCKAELEDYREYLADQDYHRSGCW